MKTKLIIAIFSFIAVNAIAQKRTTLISGKVTNELGQPLKGVNIQLIGSLSGTITDHKGNYNFRVKNRTKFELKYSFVGFEKSVESFDLENDSNLVVIKDIKLKQQAQELPQATINAEYLPDIVYSSYEHNVADFVFLPYGYLFLAYDNFQKYSTKLLVLDQYKQVKTTHFTPEPIQELFTDFEGAHYAVGKHGVYKIKILTNRLQMIKVDKTEFEQNIKKLEDTLIGGNVLLSNYEWFYPRFSYFETNPWVGNSVEVKEIVNHELEHLMRMQYYFMSLSDKTYARKLGAKYGTEKQVVAALMTGFQHSIYYEQLYAPLLVVNDTVNIFDHYSNYLYKYMPSLGVIDSISISYHKSEKDKNWEREIILDEETNQIYAVFEKEGHKTLKRINRHTGEIEGEFKLYYEWIERIKIKNNKVYYVYRPYESVRKKFLYKEEIVME